MHRERSRAPDLPFPSQTTDPDSGEARAALSPERAHCVQPRGAAMLRSIQIGLFLIALVAFSPPALAAETSDSRSDTLLVRHPEVVVSATRTPRNQVNV